MTMFQLKITNLLKTLNFMANFGSLIVQFPSVNFVDDHTESQYQKAGQAF